MTAVGPSRALRSAIRAVVGLTRTGPSRSNVVREPLTSFRCNSARNVSRYCNREVDAKIDEQSATFDPVKRKQLVQAIDLILQQDVAWAPMYHSSSTACWHSYVKGYVRAKNGIYTHLRM